VKAALRPGWAQALALILAAAAGGLRSDLSWLAFAALVSAWFIRSGPALAVEGREAAALFFCWLASAAAFSPDFALSLPALVKYILAGLVFFSAAAAPDGRQAWLRGVYVIGAVAAVTLLAQRLSGGWVIGIMGQNPNYSAAFCAAGFPAALLGAVPDGGKKEKILKALLALLLGAGVIASGSRGALLAAMISAAAGLAVSRRWTALAVFAAAALGAAALLPGETWAGLLKFSDPRAFARPRLWGVALSAAAASPWLGWGPGLFSSAFELFKFPFFDGISYYGHATLHAHSEVLNIAAEAGLPAALFFLAAATGGLLRRGGSLPLKLCAFAVLLQGSVDMIFYSGAVALLFWGSLGFAGAEEGPAKSPSRGWRLAAALFLPAGLLLSVLSARVPSGGAFAAQAEAAAEKNPALALALVRRAGLDYPKDPFLKEAEGRLLVSLKDLAGAGEAFAGALALEPGFAAARLGLAGVYAAGGREAEACGLLAGVKRDPAAQPRTAYHRGLTLYDAEAAGEIEKKICGKKKTGGAIAPGRKTR
jgi:hypothetical protein